MGTRCSPRRPSIFCGVSPAVIRQTQAGRRRMGCTVDSNGSIVFGWMLVVCQCNPPSGLCSAAYLGSYTNVVSRSRDKRWQGDLNGFWVSLEFDAVLFFLEAPT